MGVSFNAFCALSAIEDKKPGRGMVVTDEGEREGRGSVKLNTERSEARFIGSDTQLHHRHRTPIRTDQLSR